MSTYNTPILTRILKSARTKDYFNCIHPVSMIDYDHLYEQWNKPVKPQWNKMFLANNIESVTFKEKIEFVPEDYNNEWIGYWFFKQRTDKRPIFLNDHSGNKNVEYSPNRMLVCKPSQRFNVPRVAMESHDKEYGKSPEHCFTLWVQFDKQTNAILDKAIKEPLDP
tara:strand:+ start:804 stop:1301 length:498 start_codon:yes stop_codon:yes gene_type:complete